MLFTPTFRRSITGGAKKFMTSEIGLIIDHKRHGFLKSQIGGMKTLLAGLEVTGMPVRLLTAKET
jgi:hypothetical protein